MSNQRKSKIAGFILLAALLIVGGMAFFSEILHNHKEEVSSERQQGTDSGIEKKSPDADGVQTQQAGVAPQLSGENGIEPETPEEGTDYTVEYMRYIFVGDSRYKGMSYLAGDKDYFIAENNMSFPYLVQQESHIRSVATKGTALIIGLGVNNISLGAQVYIDKVNEMAQTMECDIYYMTINPVDEQKEESYGYGVENAKIAEFNKKLKAGLSKKVQVIDTNSYLNSIGFETVDGLHYTQETYRQIYQYTKQVIGSQKVSLP